MDTVVYIRIILRWLWLIVIVAAVFGAAGFLFARSRTPQYSATATIQVGSPQDAQNPSTDQILTSQQLADTYAVIAKTYPVLEAAVNELDLEMSPSTLGNYFQVSIIPKTSLLRITVTYPEAELAADIANQLASELVANSPIRSTSEQAQTETFLIAEVDETRLQLESARNELNTLEEENSGEEIPSSVTARRDSLISQINAAQSNLAQLTNTLAYLQREGRSSSLQMVERARVPGSSTGYSPMLLAVLGAIVGGTLAGGAMLLKELLSDSIQSPSDLSVQFGLPIIGSIAPFRRKDKNPDKLVAWRHPHSTISEAYRALRVNLTYAAQNATSQPVVYLLTSTRPGEGKSVTAANLAIVYALSGMKVLLVDADLHRPVQHKLFNLSNSTGLSDLSLPLPPAEEAIPEGNSNNNHHVIDDISRVISKTDLSGLDVITAGSLSPVPAGLLATMQMQKPIHKIATYTDYQVVIFDTPPMLSLSDTSLLARLTHGSVVMVVDLKRAKRGSIIRSVQQLASLSIPLTGVILNRLHPRALDASYSTYTHGRYESVPAVVTTQEVYAVKPEAPTPIQN